MTFKAKLFTFHIPLFLQSEAESCLNLKGFLQFYCVKSVNQSDQRISSCAERLKHLIYFGELENNENFQEFLLYEYTDTKVSSSADFYKMTGQRKALKI